MTARSDFDKPVAVQSAWFVAVGCVGFAVDAGGYYLFADTVGLPPLLARLLAFVPATVVTWVLNRSLSFSRVGQARRGLGAQYLRYVAVQSLGIAVSFGVFYVALYSWPMPPMLALALGSLAAMVLNFAGSRLFVFSRGA